MISYIGIYIYHKLIFSLKIGLSKENKPILQICAKAGSELARHVRHTHMSLVIQHDTRSARSAVSVGSVSVCVGRAAIHCVKTS